MARFAMLCLVAALCAASAAGEALVHGNELFAGDKPLPEPERVKLFLERHGAWPDPKWLERESPEYSRRMEERTREVMAIMDHTKRWDEWMQLAQARMVPRFTEMQYEKVRVPEAVHAKLLKRFHEMLPKAGFETKTDAVKGNAKFFPQEELNYEVQADLIPMFSEWCGMPVEPTAVYGVRVYQEGQTLDDHVDVIETHVVSGILHVDSSLDEPYPIQIEGSDGKLASADLQPGEMLFYESAKSYHQRSIPMKGRYYASIFIHYRPIGWNLTRHDVRAAIPPYWADGLPTAAPADGALLVTFQNSFSDPVEIHYIVGSVDGKDQMQQLDTIASGQSKAFNTVVGSSFIAIDPKDRNNWERFDMEASHHGTQIPIGKAWAGGHTQEL